MQGEQNHLDPQAHSIIINLIFCYVCLESVIKVHSIIINHYQSDTDNMTFICIFKTESCC